MNILLALMGLDIGGAETHVVTLAIALKKNGHKVVVASSGGMYEKELELAGVPHVYAPLARKTPQAILKSVKAMTSAIKTYDIDIIHSHGRIPALIGGIVSTITGKKFMTTVHAMYKLNSYKWLSFFGKETICISEDIRQYVINEYGVTKDKITVIPNCIDVEKFSPEASSNTEVFTIGYISRMQETLAERAVKVAEMLSTYACEKDLKIRLLIVGDGDDYNQVVSQINDLIKRISELYDKKYIEIQLLGKRMDIPELMHEMDVVVCVSRVAMEAMSSGKPVILLGGEGYEGLLSKENYNHAKGSNFTGRTSDMVFEETSFIELIESLRVSESTRADLGRWGRERILSEYSIDEILKETLAVYKAL